MNTLITKIFDLADNYDLYGSINDDTLLMNTELGNGPEYIAECFTDQDGGESPDAFYHGVIELFEECV